MKHNNHLIKTSYQVADTAVEPGTGVFATNAANTVPQVHACFSLSVPETARRPARPGLHGSAHVRHYKKCKFLTSEEIDEQSAY